MGHRQRFPQERDLLPQALIFLVKLVLALVQPLQFSGKGVQVVHVFQVRIPSGSDTFS